MPIEIAQGWGYDFHEVFLRGKPTVSDLQKNWQVPRMVGVKAPLGRWKEWVDLVNAFGRSGWDLWRYDLTNGWVNGQPEDRPSSEGMIFYSKRLS